MRMKTPSFMYRLTYTAFIIACVTCSISARDRAHFYSTYPIWQEPRVEKDWLMSLDAWVYTGKAKQGKNGDHCTTRLLDIYGTYNMHVLGDNVPGKDLSKYTDLLLTLLSQIPSCNSTFAQRSFCGPF